MPFTSINFAAPGSSSGPYLDLTKNFSQLFQQAAGLGSSAQPAVDVYKNLGTQLNNLFQNYGAGQRADINQRFDVQRNNALGSLAKRGFSGSSLAGSTASAVERDRSLALGQFEDSLLGQRIGASQQVAEGLAGAYMGAADISQRLREALLGLNESRSTSSTGGGGGSSRSGTSYAEDARNSFEEFRSRYQSSGGGGGGSGGGGSGGGGSSGGGQPVYIDNPYGAPAGGEGAVPGWANPDTVKELGGFSSTGPPGAVGETYVVGGLTCTITASNKNFSKRSCVPTAALEQSEQQPPPVNATGGIPGDLGAYENVA